MEPKGYILFDIDGVIRDVTNSYRLAIQKTVESYLGSIPSIGEIDKLKSEGCWNNDWDVSFELLNRKQKQLNIQISLPSKNDLIEKFNNFYFGGDYKANSNTWKGYIRNEELLINSKFFKTISNLNIKWGFVSGAEPPSAKYVLEEKLGLIRPPLIAMDDAPEKPNPEGFLNLIEIISKSMIDKIDKPIAYLGDTVADVLTVVNARKTFPKQNFISFAVAPPHLHKKNKRELRSIYEKKLVNSGADFILEKTYDLIGYLKKWK